VPLLVYAGAMHVSRKMAADPLLPSLSWLGCRAFLRFQLVDLPVLA
jgi:hypothetical protein